MVVGGPLRFGAPRRAEPCRAEGAWRGRPEAGRGVEGGLPPARERSATS
jgi:hypothetical protein